MATITGDRLRALRQELGLSQEEVAKKINISRPAYVNYEQGKSRPVRRLEELSKLFNASTDYILGNTDIRHHLLGDINNTKHSFNKVLSSNLQGTTVDPSPEFYSDPETRELMHKMQNDPKHRRIFLASKDLKPEELDQIATLMETIINARKSKEESS